MKSLDPYDNAPVGPDMPPGLDRSLVGQSPAGKAVKRGRPKKEYDKAQLEQVVRLYFLERMSVREVARVVGVSHMSVYRLLCDPDVEVLL